MAQRLVRRICDDCKGNRPLSVEEAAATLGIPEATVRSRHFRAKGLLRESLAREIDTAERDLYEFGGVRCDRIVELHHGRIAGTAA